MVPVTILGYRFVLYFCCVVWTVEKDFLRNFEWNPFGKEIQKVMFRFRSLFGWFSPFFGRKDSLGFLSLVGSFPFGDRGLVVMASQSCVAEKRPWHSTIIDTKGKKPKSNKATKQQANKQTKETKGKAKARTIVKVFVSIFTLFRI